MLLNFQTTDYQTMVMFPICNYLSLPTRMILLSYATKTIQSPHHQPPKTNTNTKHTNTKPRTNNQAYADGRGEAASPPGPCMLHLGQDWHLWITVGLILPASAEIAYNTMVTFFVSLVFHHEQLPHFCNMSIRISQIFKFWNLFSFLCFGSTIPSLIHLLPLKRNQTTPPAL